MTGPIKLKKECFKLWRAGTGQRTITTCGFSMHPLIPEGSTLTFIPASADRAIMIGDIALFERGDTLVAHRIIGRFYKNGALWLREKGDNSVSIGCFPYDCLVGRILKIECAGKICDLSRPLFRIAGRMLGIYWCLLFALYRAIVSIKRFVIGDAEFPRLRSMTRKAINFLARLPYRVNRS
jgi:hypothetical protein